MFKLFKKQTKTFDKEALPKHVAIIMDGNGRWAKKHSVPRVVGHRTGAETLKKISRHAGILGVKYITVYAFSTENWKRSEEEVSGLMGLLLHYLKTAETELAGDNARICVIGDRSRFAPEIQAEMERVEKVTAANDGVIVTLALNYGSRDEMTRAVKALAQKVHDGALLPDEIDEKAISESLYTHFLPDPDLIIRTSGEMRLSNFLMWQSAYSEFYFTNKLWPDFSEKDFDAAMEAFLSRNRRFGGR